MDRIEELLTITMEECGEVIQACSKIMRFRDSAKNIEELEKEIGDLYCMIDLLHREDLVSWTNIDDQSKRKEEKLKEWSNLFDS